MAVPHSGTGNGRESPRMARLPAVFLVFLSGLAGALASCADPPPPAAEYPLAAPPTGAESQPVVGAEDCCGLVKRAKRTWVEFGPGMTLDDMVPAGVAAAAVVRALDAAVRAAAARTPGSGVAASRLAAQDTSSRRRRVRSHEGAVAGRRTVSGARGAPRTRRFGELPMARERDQARRSLASRVVRA